MPTSDESGLFVPGREVLVRKTFEGIACRFEAGERLQCERQWYSVYDSLWFHELRRANGDVLTWPLEGDAPPPKWWHERFEACP